MFLKILLNSQENTTLLKRETVVQAFPSEFCEIFKSTYFEERLRTADSDSTSVISDSNSVISTAILLLVLAVYN